jgi:hypothetical protein
VLGYGRMQVLPMKTKYLLTFVSNYETLEETRLHTILYDNLEAAESYISRCRHNKSYDVGRHFYSIDKIEVAFDNIFKTPIGKKMSELIYSPKEENTNA